jgi:polygalacturonase
MKALIFLLWICATDVLVFAESRVFNVMDHGAKGDGVASETAAINKAIEAASAAGGGQVLIPAGRFLSGTVKLRSDIALFLDAGATLVGTTNLSEYYQPTPPSGTPEARWGKWHRALLVGENVENVTIAGPGAIDGNKVFDPTGEEKIRGPHTLVFHNSKNIHVRDVTILDSANYAVYFMHSDDMEFRGVKIIGGWDGIHWRGGPDRWCKNVDIIDCQIYTGDDAIAGRYWENTLIKGCILNSSCNGIRLIGPARNLTIHGNLFPGPGRQPHRSSRDLKRTSMLAGIMLQPGGWDATHGPLEEITITDNTMKNVASPINIWNKRGNTVGRVIIDGLKATGVYRSAISVESWADEPIGEVVIRNASVEFTGGGKAEQATQSVRGPGVDVRPMPAWGVYARNVKTLSLTDVRLGVVEGDARPVIMTEKVENLHLANVNYPTNDAVKELVVRKP